MLVVWIFCVFCVLSCDVFEWWYMLVVLVIGCCLGKFDFWCEVLVLFLGYGVIGNMVDFGLVVFGLSLGILVFCRSLEICCRLDFWVFVVFVYIGLISWIRLL